MSSPPRAPSLLRATFASGTILVAAALAPARASAQPACTTQTLAGYLALGAGGCTVDGIVFSGFALTPPVGSAMELNAALDALTLTPTTASLNAIAFAGFQLSGPQTNLVATGADALASGNACPAGMLPCYALDVGYDFSVVARGVTGVPVTHAAVANLVGTTSAAPGWVATVFGRIHTLQTGSQPLDPAVPPEVTRQQSTAGIAGFCVPFWYTCPTAAVGRVDLRYDRFEVLTIAEARTTTAYDGGGTADARLTSVAMLFSVTPVPEPTTVTLVGMGLLAIAARRVPRRRG
jgi:hypothetical protein